MKTIFKIFMVLVLFASIQYANSADVVKVQRAVPVKPEQLSNPVEPAIKPQSKQTRKSLKSEETPEIKQKKLQELKRESTNYARKHVNMSDEELQSSPYYCNFKNTLTMLGAKNINVLYLYTPNEETLKEVGPKIHGLSYKPKRCVHVSFTFENKPYYTTWCK